LPTDFFIPGGFDEEFLASSFLGGYATGLAYCGLFSTTGFYVDFVCCRLSSACCPTSFEAPGFETSGARLVASFLGAF
jgi:hypothetical protein